MGTFTPIAMRCTQEQFNAVKPKLRGVNIHEVDFHDFILNSYLTNNLVGNDYVVSNISEHCKRDYNREVHEEWNEETFLKACGIVAETLQEKEQRLLKELEKVRKEIEDSKIKDGDWVYCSFGNYIFKYTHGIIISDLKKITDPELISKLNELIKT